MPTSRPRPPGARWRSGTTRGSARASTATTRRVWPFWDALYRAKADVVVNGHDHDYERFAPQDPAGREDKAAGIREFVVGTGGAVLRDFPTVAAHSEVRIASTFGVIRFVLHPTSYEWSFIATVRRCRGLGNWPVPLRYRRRP